LSAAFPRPLGNIDHHLSNDGFAAHNVVDQGAAATAELLGGLLIDCSVGFDAITAQALYAGVMTDTGQFRFPSTTGRAFALTGHLIEAGANPAAAAAELYERESFEKLELLGRFLASLRRECGGRACVGFLTQKDFVETGANGEDTEGLVDYARAIDGVEIGALIEERADGVKASLRCKDPACRVDRIAAAFGGGGHACAAGLNVAIDLKTFYPQLVAAIEEALARLKTEG
jgi:phosphoesterase RecJ-like protein